MIKYRLFPFLLTAATLLYACGVQTTPAPTTTPSALPSPTVTTPIKTDINIVKATLAPTATLTAIPSPTKRVPVGTDIKVELPEGDLERGESQAIRKNCVHCHVDRIATRLESDGVMPNITERGEIRMADPAYNGNATTNEEYILESILLPEIYIVPGTPKDAEMPTNYDELLTKQDLADILVWLGTFE